MIRTEPDPLDDPRTTRSATAGATDERELVLRLDAWCRRNGMPSGGNRAIAAAALDTLGVRRPDWREVSIRIRSDRSPTDRLEDDPRRWPAAERYHLAELERSGVARKAAIREVRAATSGSEAGAGDGTTAASRRRTRGVRRPRRSPEPSTSARR